MISEFRKIARELLCDHEYEVVKSYTKGEFKRDVLECTRCGKRESTGWIKYPKNVIHLTRVNKEENCERYKHQSH